MTLAEAAKHFNCHPSTIRRWIRLGAPCLELGSVGRGRGSLVDIEELAQWRRADALNRDELLQQMASGFWNALDRDRVYVKVGISRTRAAELLALTFERIWWAVMQRPLDMEQLPPEMQRVCSIYLD